MSANFSRCVPDSPSPRRSAWRGEGIGGSHVVNAILTFAVDCYGWGTSGDAMPKAQAAKAALYQSIGDLLADIVAADAVPPLGRSLLYCACEGLALEGVTAEEQEAAWRLTRAVHAFEFAMIHSAAPDRIYARQALKRAHAAWTKQRAALPAFAPQVRALAA